MMKWNNGFTDFVSDANAQDLRDDKLMVHHSKFTSLVPERTLGTRGFSI